VRLYDPLGQIVVDAELKDYKPVETASTDTAGPMLPTDIHIEWPLDNTAMRLELGELSATHDVPLSVYRMDIPAEITNVRQVE
jgi:hypothetical protein